MKKSALLILALSSSFAFAYPMTVSRVNGSIACTLSDQNGKTFDCTLHVAGVGELEISMDEVKDKKGNLMGYHGVDTVTENGMNYTLMVGANDQQVTKGLSVITDNKTAGNGVFVANVAAVETGKTHVANIGPVAVDMTDVHNMKVALQFAVYGDKADHILQPANRKDLSAFLVEKVRPFLDAAKSR